MTNYNDGNWHGWNGGECPVHPKSEVEVVIQTGKGVVISTSAASRFFWEEDLNAIIAFRVVKEYKEPREWWVIGVIAYDKRKDAVRMAKYSGDEVIHVREVLE